MLDDKDLQAIQKMIDASESRMTAKIAESAEQSRRYMDVIIESSIKPTLDLLAEGQTAIKEMLVPRSRVDDLEDEVKFLKLMCRQMAEDIAKLKKAN